MRARSATVVTVAGGRGEHADGAFTGAIDDVDHPVQVPIAGCLLLHRRAEATPGLGLLPTIEVTGRRCLPVTGRQSSHGAPVRTIPLLPWMLRRCAPVGCSIFDGGSGSTGCWRAHGTCVKAPLGSALVCHQGAGMPE